MSASFTLDFLSNRIRIRHPVDYEITPDNHQQLWVAIGESWDQTNCWSVLAESSAPPVRNIPPVDTFISATQAAKASSSLRLRSFFKDYKTEETTEFFIQAAYSAGVRNEFFAERNEAVKRLGIGGERVIWLDHKPFAARYALRLLP